MIPGLLSSLLNHLRRRSWLFLQGPCSLSAGPPQSGTLESQNMQQLSPRSEERRVGKECRSLCDWSSDVCSSDLPAAKKLVIPSRAMLSISWSSTVRYIGEPKYATVVSPAPYEWLVISTGQAVAGS